METARKRTVGIVLGVAMGLSSVVYGYFAGGGRDVSRGNDCLIGYDGVEAGDVTLDGKKRIVTCTDCDPTCDHDGDAAANGSCTFQIGVCIDQSGVEGCLPPSGLDEAGTMVKVNGTKFSPDDLRILGFPLEGSVCGPDVDLVVPLKGKARPGNVTVTLWALVKKNESAGLSTRKDRDRLTLVCAPHPAGEPCASHTTSTSTSTTVETTMTPSTVGTTVTVTSTSVCPRYTTTSLGIPDCSPIFCSPYGCTNARECVMDDDGQCGCTGPFVSCRVITVNGVCGGTCPDGFTCQTVRPVGEDGCPGPPECGCAPAPGISCGPTLICDGSTEICVRHGPVGPAVIYECRAVPPGCELDRSCACAAATLCSAPFDVCTDLGAGTIDCQCPQCQ